MKFLLPFTLFVALLTGLTLGQEAEAPILSGEVQAFSDSTNQFSIKVPTEYKLPEAGSPVLMFMGPLYRGGALSLHINTVPMPGMSSDSLYSMNWTQKEKDPFYIDLKEVSIPGGKAFSFKEADTERGGGAKTDEAIHRWHMLAFGQGKFYNCVLAGSFSSFKDPIVTTAYQNIMKSFTISK